MDIRKFFGGPAAAKKPKEDLSKKKPESKDEGLTKLKSSKDKRLDKESQEKILEPIVVDSDENGNSTKKTHKSAVKVDKNGKNHKGDKQKTEKKRRKSKEIKAEEKICIDDDSDEETFDVKKKTSKHKGDKKEKSKHEDKKDSGKHKSEKKEKVKHEDKKDSGKKSKKRIYVPDTDEEEDIQVVASDDDDDDDAVTGKRKKPKKKDKKRQRLLDSDSDEEPLPKKARKKKKEQPLLHIGGSGDEMEEAPAPKKTFMDSFLTSGSSLKKTPTKPEPAKKTEKKETVNPADFFGSATVHSSDRTHAVSSKPGTENKAKTEATIEDIEMHSDDDFEKTLEMLDDTIPSVKKSPSKPSPSKPSPKRAKMELAIEAEAKMTSPSKPSPTKTEDKNKKECPAKTEVKKKSPNKPSPSKTDEAVKKVSPAKKTSPVKEDSETPKQKGTGYRSYLNRAGPQALGSKEIPEGAENCLEGLTFVITGVLESFERDESKSMIERYGGKVTGTVSKKTDYIVLGRDPGVSKVAKAESFKTKQLNEDELLDLIRTKPGKKSKYVLQAEESLKKETSSQKLSKLASFKNTDSKSGLKTGFSSSQSLKKEDSQSEKDKIQTDQSAASELWVDKYKPTALKQVIGQTGDKSNAKKLLNWITCWHKNQAAGVKPVTGNFWGRGGSEDGAGFKAALLSGPPGVGKTTTATLVCEEAGFSFVELNASDTRNAKSLKQEVTEAVGNNSIVDYMGTSSSTKSTLGLKHCLVMDEVDGMSGNEDRGGVQELVNIIKKTHIPIICMCNDRNHQKMRTLANHCFDLRFQRPRVEQIKGAMMSIAYREGIKIPPPALNEIIVAANQDVRQIIHNMSLWTATDKAVTYDQAKADAQQAKKDMKIGPFDVCRKVFVGGEETNKMTINDKSDLFFHDYNIAPLFVQENYIHVTPYAAKGKLSRHLSLLSRTADSLCDSDLAEKRIRTNQNWSLLSAVAMSASVIPGEYMRGNLGQMVAFPSWLGKNSTTGKTERILQELRTHMRLQISGDKKSLNLDYLPYLRQSLTEPLVQKEADGVRDVIQRMDEYDIIKEDFDNLMEITKWPNSSDPLSKLSSKTKAAFTRTYNKEVHKTPYATGALTKKKRGGGGATGEEGLDLLGEETEEGLKVEEEEDEDKEDLDLDTMIKKKTGKKAESSKKGDVKQKAATKGTSTKGKGPAKGKQTAKGKR